MQDLLAEFETRQLPLVDADLRFWPQVDFGIPQDQLLRELIESIDWHQQKITVYGRNYPQPRLSAWYGDASYRYSGISLEPLPWTPTLLEIRAQIEALTRYTFNSVLLNYYRNQDDSMGMHSDDERELGAQPVIASLSLGEARTFLLRHKSRKQLKTVKLPLPGGSLLLMLGDTQRNWKHGIAKLRQVCGPRINLTFRQVLTEDEHRGSS
jgi:alkylated DNA repair dioxygenase AlkB